MTCISLSDSISIIQTVIIAIVGVFTIIVYFRITRLTNDNNEQLNDRVLKNNQFQKLNSDLNRIIDFTIQYPYFDDEEYKKDYSKHLKSKDEKENEKALRYEVFCIMNYNFIEDLYSYFEKNTEKMFDFCNYEEIIVDHRYYWENMLKRGEKGYSKIFDLVNKILNNKGK